VKRITLLLMIVCILVSGAFNVYALEYSDEAGFVEFYPQYKVVSKFNKGVAPVVTDTGYALINQNNSVLYSTEGEVIGYKDGIVRIKNGSAIYFLDEYYAVVTVINDSQIIYAKEIINGKISVQNSELKFGLLSVSGDFLLDCVYDDVICSVDNENVVLCKKDSKWFLLDLKNDKITEVANLIAYTNSLIINSNGTNYGAVNFDGKTVLPYKYSKINLGDEYIYAFTESIIDWYTETGDLVCSTDLLAENLSEGLYYDQATNTYRDSKGTVVIETEKLKNVKSGQSFSENFAVVDYDDGQSYIKKNGELATDKVWDCAYRFSNGYALVYNLVYDSNLQDYDEMWYIINSDFEVVKSLDYDVYVDPYYSASTDFSDGYIRTIDNETGLMGFIYLENYSASSNNQLKLSPTSLYQIDRESQIVSEVLKDTTVKDFKNHFLNDMEMLSVVDADGNTLNDDAYVVDGCKVQLISKSNGTTILDELTIQVSEKATETDPPTTDPDTPIDPDTPGTDPNEPDNDSDVTDFIDSIADKVGVTSDQLLMIAGGSLAALVLLIIVIAAIKRKRR